MCEYKYEYDYPPKIKSCDEPKVLQMENFVFFMTKTIMLSIKRKQSEDLERKYQIVFLTIGI